MERIPTQEITVESLMILDLDRHILNTDTFHILLRESAFRVAGIHASEIDRIKRKMEEEGESVHTDELLSKILTQKCEYAIEKGVIPEKTPNQTLQDIFADVIDTVRTVPELKEALFMPGAEEFIDELRQTGAIDRNEVMFLTHGTEPLQILKLIVLELEDIPYIVMDNSAKGTFLADSRNEDGDYRLEPMNKSHTIVTKNITVFDDKASIFEKLPSLAQGAKGFLKRFRGHKVRKSQEGKIPENVEIIWDFPSVSLGQVAVEQANNIDK